MNDNKIKTYNDMIYDTRPVKFSDFMSNKYNIVHRKIYLNALNKYINEWLKVKESINELNELSQLDDITNEDEEKIKKLKNFITNHKNDKKHVDGDFVYYANNYDEFVNGSCIVEILNSEYWKPSSIKIMTKFKSKKSPNLKWKVDLTPYWNTYQDKRYKELSKIKMMDGDIVDATLVNMNYVKGKATIYSESLNREFEVDFDYLDGDNIEISEDLLLSNTFGYN